MKNNSLLKPLINSVLVLAVFSLLIYLIAGSPETTIWSSFWSALGMIVMGVLRTLQWIIAMLLALLVCLAFLFAIFFSAVALFDREISSKMYGNLKKLLFSWLPSFTGQCCCSTAQSSQEEATTKPTTKPTTEAVAEAFALKQECDTMNTEINSIQ